MQRRSYILYIIIFLVSLSVFESGCWQTDGRKIKVVATTSLIKSAVQDVGDGLVDVTVLIPPGTCPGHYDIRPVDVKRMSECRILFYHGFEALPKAVLSISGNHRAFRIRVAGNWLVPENYKRALELIADELSRADPDHRREYMRRCISMNKRIDDIACEVRRELGTKLREGTAVICSDQQASLLKWMGLTVVATYGRAEEFTPRMIHDLLEKGRRAKVALIVDNLQSGPAAGKQIAEDLGVRHVVLSNFPGGFENTDTWERCFRENVRRLVAVLSERAE